ncbi:MAG: aminopeptidase N, partial [Actinobacteria bacterium]|nr:aminopeptidase N [Actinomycetota bacterium]
IATLKSHLGKLDDALARALCWAYTWDMHRDAEISSADFIEVALSGLAGETDDAIVNIVIAQLGTSVEAYATDANRHKYREKLANGFWELTSKSAPGSDLQLLYSRAFAANAHTEDQIQKVRGLLEGSAQGLKIDADLRWYFLISLTERGATTKQELEAELAKDNTTSGNLFFETATAAAPNAEAKAYAFNKVMDTHVATSVRSALVAGFQRPIQRHILESFVDLYFENLLSQWKSKSYEIAAKYVTGLYPSWVLTQKVMDKTNSWLSGEGKDAPAVLRKLVKESQDGLIRALKVQKLDI